MAIGTNLPFLRTKDVVLIDCVELTQLLFDHRNHFIRVVWHSDQNKRLRKTGDGAPYKTKKVRKLYVATARNNFNFANRVRKILADQGALKDAKNWQPQARTWGKHIEGTPFLIYENGSSDCLERLYGHFLIEKFWNYDGITGFYVDGEKALGDEDAMLWELSSKEKKSDESRLDKARRLARPTNARLDDIVGIRVGGQWYRVKRSTMKLIETLANLGQSYQSRQAA